MPNIRAATIAVALIALLKLTFIEPAVAADSIRDEQWHLRLLKASEANDISTGEGVIVAVIDSGVDPHPDLRSNLLSGGSVLDSRRDNGQGDTNGHGTLMASLIAATGRSNNSGVIGLAPKAKILPVRDADSAGRGNSIQVAEAIEWAITNEATVVNISRSVAPSLGLKDAIASAAAADVLVVAAAGNIGQDVVTAYPAAMEGVLAVGASDRSSKPATFTRPGKHVAICAPGVDIVGAKPGGRYSIGDAPHKQLPLLRERPHY